MSLDQKYSLNIKNAAEYADVSRDVISEAIKRGDLIANYPTSRPVIKVSELEAWIDNTPTESPRGAA